MDRGVDLGSIPREALALVAALAVALALTQALLRAGARWLRRRRMSLRMERAVRGEQRAPGWLEARGYRVLGAQVSVEHPVRVDDRVVVVALRADYLAEKDGARFVVEVKTGALAPRLETSATRRQMLEYRIAFDVDGVVLVDAEQGTVHEVTFPALARFAEPRPSGSWRLAAVALAAAAAGLALARYV
jgi:hypothetical protein